MTRKYSVGSRISTKQLIDTLSVHLKSLKNAPLHERAGVAVGASQSLVVVLRDLDRRIQQLEISASDQQDNRHGDLPAV